MQHREWNPKAFFRKLSPEVMSRYEARRNIALARDPARPPADRTYHAWNHLPERQRLELETELLPVNDLCSTHARPYLDSLANAVWSQARRDLIEASREWSVHDLAMRLFLDAPEGIIRTHQSYAVDMMDHFREYRGKNRVSLNSPLTMWRS